MQEANEVLEYARRLALEVQQDLVWEPGTAGRGWWHAVDRSNDAKIRARAASVLEFLRQYAGADSYWTSAADAELNGNGGGQSHESGVRALGDLLLAWVAQVEAGVIEIAGARARAEFRVVSTDIMQQVRALLEDRRTHPAAAIVLAGGALETALRAVVSGRGLPMPSRPSISAYSGALRKAALISVQDVKDLEQCGGLRNAAAHGEFENLSLERAGLMEQQVNLLLRQLADLNQY